MQYLCKIQLAVLFFAFINLAAAGERLLQIELIVFQQQVPSTEIFKQTQTLLKPVAQYAHTSTGTKSLQTIYHQLQQSKIYQPFYYQSWQILASSNSISLPIAVVEPEADLIGWIKIQRSYFLHLIVDLEFSPTNLEFGAPEPVNIIYRLNEKRRVLLNDLHYLDHPKFGAVVKVSPIEQENL